ncbi:MAG TPA: peptide chain release factor N(5)-glutamine methyltransferase [Ignavibacteria bacterium]|nr:peptide chain release factor N(5)-glutamine methyltransferase [Ignavibacteria bacterium]
MQEKLTTLLQILNYSAELLAKNGIREPRLNAELMLSDALKCRRLDLYLNFDKPLLENEVGTFKSYLKRRLNKEPLQYILGSTNFYGYDIEVNENVLIPRQDTEVLVEKFLERTEQADDVSILEIGSGSGCIATAIVRELEKAGRNYFYTAVDNSDNAIEMTRRNLLNNKADSSKYLILKRDCLSSHFSIGELEKECGKGFNYIVSNPPYISIEEYGLLDEEVRKHEPKKALTDDGDGLVFYRKLLEIKGNRELFLEIAYNRKDELTKLLKSKNLNDFEFLKDYSENYRVLILK